MIITVEEHNIIGGLGSAVSEVMSTVKNSPKQLFWGLKIHIAKVEIIITSKKNFDLHLK